MRSWSPAEVYRPIPRNVVFYEGPSQLTGEPILAIATRQNGNRKIGRMLQLWILPAISPIAAVKSGGDVAVCGDCKLRGDGHGNGRACYVEYWRAVENIWQGSARARRLPAAAFAETIPGIHLRIGAYGDPVAVPLSVWMDLLPTAGGWTAYTHQWRRPESQAHRAFVMASVDSAEERDEAQAMGWRTFRVRPSLEDGLAADEVICPASDEGGHRATCGTCSLCRGQARPAKSISIVAHSMNAKWFPATLHRRERVLEGVG